MKICSIALATLLSVVSSLPSMAQNALESGKGPAMQGVPVDFAKLVDSLKNRNTKPRIIGGWEVKFVANYDFAEQRRNYKAIKALQIYAEEAWPHLVRNLDNADYSVTFGFSDASVNYTVGQVCEQVIRNALHVYHDHCGDIVSGTNTKMTELKEPELREVKRLRAWLTDRQSKSLLDMQIELVEKLKARIRKLDMPEARKWRFIESADEHLRYIRARGYAETGNQFIPNRESWWHFTLADAIE